MERYFNPKSKKWDGPDADYSPTTRRHVKEFAKQQAGKSISTEELRAVVDGRMRFEDAGQPLA